MPPPLQVNVPNVHRFFQDNTQRYGAAGMWRMRLLHQRCATRAARTACWPRMKSTCEANSLPHRSTNLALLTPLVEQAGLCLCLPAAGWWCCLTLPSSRRW